MARVKLSPLLSEVNGSIGSSTFQRSLGGVMLRNKPIRKPKGSALQLQTHSYMSAVISVWQGLTSAQRLAWNQYADFTPQKMIYNKLRSIKGYYLFVKYNMIRLQAGLNILSSASFLSPDPLVITPEIQTVDENFFVGIGSGAVTLAWSNNGIDWTANGAAIFTSVGRAVCWNGSIFVAVGAGTNSIAWSSDGKNWNGLGTAIFSTSGFGVCWNGSIFVAVGEGTNTIAWSSDGVNWNGLGEGNIDTAGSGVCWNGSIFVAVGQGSNSIVWSPDGVNWNNLGNSIFSSAGRGVCWNGSRFVAVGEGTNTIAYSNDGINWTGLGTSIFSSAGRGVTSSGSRFIGVGDGTNTIAYSNDGINWTGLGLDIFSTSGRAIFFNGFRYVAGGSGTNSLAYSSDGINWTGIGLAVFSSTCYGVCSISVSDLTPVILHDILIDYNIDLDNDDQWALLKISNSRPRTENYKSNSTRVIVISISSAESFNIQDQIYELFGTNPFSGDILNVEITPFSQIASRLYPITKQRLTIVAT